MEIWKNFKHKIVYYCKLLFQNKKKSIVGLPPDLLAVSLIFIICMCIFCVFFIINNNQKNILLTNETDKNYNVFNIIPVNDKSIILISDKINSQVIIFNNQTKELSKPVNTITRRTSPFLQKINDNEILICGGEDILEHNKFCEKFFINKMLSSTTNINLSNITKSVELKNGNTLIFNEHKYFYELYKNDYKIIKKVLNIPNNIDSIDSIINMGDDILFIISLDGHYCWYDYSTEKVLNFGDIHKRFFNVVSDKQTVIISGGTKEFDSVYYDIDNEIIECSIKNYKCIPKGKLQKNRSEHKAIFINDNNILYAGGDTLHTLLPKQPKNISFEIYNKKDNKSYLLKDKIPLKENIYLIKINNQQSIVFFIDNKNFMYRVLNIKNKEEGK